jgi:hypothetical protein
MKKVLLTCFLLALPLVAQNEKKDSPPVNSMVEKLYILKYADPNSLAQLLRVFNVGIVPNTEMHAIGVHAPGSTIPAIDDAIARLDVPASAPHNIELTAYLVIGTDSEATSLAALPKDLESVVTQLKNAFPFKNYRLMDVMNLRGRTGEQLRTSSAGGVLPNGSTVTTALDIRSLSVGPDNTTVRINSLRSSTRFPAGNTMQDLGFNTDLDIKEGQKVVVGRQGLNHDQALFLVLTAKIVN